MTAFLIWSATPLASRAGDVPLEEVKITASRRQTRLLETPLSMTVLSAEDLSNSNADAFADFARQVPGLTAIDSGPGNKRYALRGLQSAGEPEVALYYDEIPIRGLPGFSLDTGDSQPDFKLWDVERIEVLRGPQGTLYGNGSMGGTLRVISKRPVLDEIEAAAQAQTAYTEGGRPSWRLNAMVNTPIVTDRLAVRVAAYYRHEGGWIDSPYRADIALPQPATGTNLNSEETWGGRASATFKATDRWTLTAIAYYQDLETASSFETYPAFAVTGDPYVAKTFVQTPWLDKSRMFNLISTYDLGWAAFDATGSYQHRGLDRSTDTTRFLLSQTRCTEFTAGHGCTPLPVLPADAFSHEEVSSTSAEVRLVSQHSRPLDWALGAFLERATTDRRGQVAKTDVNGFVQFDPATGDAVNRLFARNNHDTFEQGAFFGEGTWHVLPKLDAILGLRRFHSDRSDQQVLVQQFFPGQPTGAQPYQRFTQGALFKKFELSSQLTPDALLYVQAAQGFRAGGPNYPGGFTATAPPYGADSVWDYEVGWKLLLADRRVAWTGAVFRIDWSDLQQLVPTSLFSYIANAGRARSDGIEMQWDARVTERFTVTAGTSYSDARLVGPQPMQINPDLQLHDGDPLANVPKWTASASATYRTSLSGAWWASARFDYSYQSSRGNLVARQNPAYFLIPASYLASLHLSVDRESQWRVSLDVENLFDRFVPVSAKSLDSNLVQSVTAARPRMTTLGLRWTF